MGNRRLDIQGLRAVAVLMVVAFHAGLPVPGGFVGVDVFFVISGFVIAGMLDREWRTTRRIRFGQFYLRRFKRLTPALALVVAVTMFASAAVLSPLGLQQTAAKTGIGAMLLFANVVIAETTGGYFDADAHTNPLLHTWSLSVEEQFYLCFPALIAIGWYAASRRTAFRLVPHAIVGVIALVSLGLACFGTALISTMGLPSSLLTGTYARWTQALMGFYSPITRSWEFALGVLLALFAHRLPQCRRVGFLLSLVGAALLLTSLWLVSGAKPFPSAWTLIPVIGTLLLLAGGTAAPTNSLARALTVKPIVKVGDWSYSIYLWHWPFIVFTGILWQHNRIGVLCAAAASFVPAVASYHWLETPIRNIKGLRGRRMVKVVTIALFVPLFLSLFTNFAADRGYWSDGVRAMQSAVLQPHAISTTRCAAGNLSSGNPDESCKFNADGAGKPIYLIGDSTAWHFSEAAIDAARLLGRPLTIINVPAGCPFKNLYLHSVNAPTYRDARACRQGYESAMQWLSGQSPGTVMISELNGFYQDADTAFGLEPDAFTTKAAERIQVLDDGLTSTVRMLERTGQTVLLVQAAPYFAYPERFNPLRCGWSELVGDRCIANMPRSVADAIQQPQRSSLQRIAAQTGAHLWDPRDFFCSSDACSTKRYGIDLYRDAFHISASASRMLAASLAAAIARST
jgi:peptidoglycan/LPS O-acetylase OafA/YrhL